jgi:hypothetical protein
VKFAEIRRRRKLHRTAWTAGGGGGERGGGDTTGTRAGGGPRFESLEVGEAGATNGTVAWALADRCAVTSGPRRLGVDALGDWMHRGGGAANRTVACAPQAAVRSVRHSAVKLTVAQRAGISLCSIPAPRGQTAQPNPPTSPLCTLRRPGCLSILCRRSEETRATPAGRAADPTLSPFAAGPRRPAPLEPRVRGGPRHSNRGSEEARATRTAAPRPPGFPTCPHPHPV